MNEPTFPGFAFTADELSAYIFSADVFIISLSNQQVIRHSTPDAAAFRDWLQAHGIRDINEEAGDLVRNYYFGRNEMDRKLKKKSKNGH